MTNSELKMDKVDGRKCDHGDLEHMRLQAMAKVACGESPEDVVKSLGLSRSCIYKWMAKFRIGGSNALKAKNITGRPSKLEPEQVEWLLDVLLNFKPPAMQFARGLWTREIVRELLLRKFGLTLTLPLISRLLVKVGVVFHPPLYKIEDRDIAPVKAWLESEYMIIKSRARKERAEILICWDDYLFSPPGDQALMQISAVSARGVEHFLLAEDQKKEDAITEFLDGLCFGRKRPIYLLVNNHPIYRSQFLRSQALKHKPLLQLHYMPVRLSIFWRAALEENLP